MRGYLSRLWKRLARLGPVEREKRPTWTDADRAYARKVIEIMGRSGVHKRTFWNKERIMLDTSRGREF